MRLWLLTWVFFFTFQDLYPNVLSFRKLWSSRTEKKFIRMNPPKKASMSTRRFWSYPNAGRNWKSSQNQIKFLGINFRWLIIFETFEFHKRNFTKNLKIPQEILKKVNVKVHIEIQPKYLVPDTNCFIDSLDELQIIANDFENYFLIVPLIGKKHTQFLIFQHCVIIFSCQRTGWSFTRIQGQH